MVTTTVAEAEIVGKNIERLFSRFFLYSFLIWILYFPEIYIEKTQFFTFVKFRILIIKKAVST